MRTNAQMSSLSYASCTSECVVSGPQEGIVISVAPVEENAKQRSAQQGTKCTVYPAKITLTQAEIGTAQTSIADVSSSMKTSLRMTYPISPQMKNGP